MTESNRVELQVKFEALLGKFDLVINEMCHLRLQGASRNPVYRTTDDDIIELFKALKGDGGFDERIAWETLRNVATGIVQDIKDGRYEDVFGHEDITLTPLVLMYACMASRPDGLDTMELIRKCPMSLSSGVLELELFTERERLGGAIAGAYGLPTHIDGAIDKMGSALKIGKGLLFGKW